MTSKRKYESCTREAHDSYTRENTIRTQEKIRLVHKRKYDSYTKGIKLYTKENTTRIQKEIRLFSSTRMFKAFASPHV